MTDKPERHTRRTILKYGLAAMGGTALLGLGWEFRPVKKPEFVSEPLMPLEAGRPTLLVAYASMMGSTGGQARTIAQAARQAGFAARVARVGEDVDPSDYDAVILMSAIRRSSWLDEMLDFAAAHEKAIVTRPHALLQCSMTCAGLELQAGPAGLGEGAKAHLRNDMDSLLSRAPALADAPYGFLAGKLDYDYLQPAQRLLYPVFSGSLLSGDFRDPVKTRKQFETILETPAFAALLHRHG